MAQLPSIQRRIDTGIHRCNRTDQSDQTDRSIASGFTLHVSGFTHHFSNTCTQVKIFTKSWSAYVQTTFLSLVISNACAPLPCESRLKSATTRLPFFSG